MSRPTVSRLLREARRTGVVRIDVVPPAAARSFATELAAALGIRAVMVAPTGTADAPAWDDLAELAGRALVAALPEAGGTLLVSWGRTVWEVVGRRFPRLQQVVVAPAMAGADEPEEWFDTNVLARRLAAAIGGRRMLLRAPSHPSAALMRALRRDPWISRVLDCWDRADALIASVGAPPRAIGDYGPSNHPRSRQALSGAAGDIASRYYDEQGRPIAYDGEPSLLGISRAQLLAVPHKIALAVGEHKAVAVVGAARAGLLDVVVTDLRTARRIANVLDRPGS